MAKQTEKKEFAWDSEVVLKTVEVSEKERHEIKLCTLGAKKFIVDTKMAMFKEGGWKPVKNSTMEMSIFEHAYEALNDFNFREAFDPRFDNSKTGKGKNVVSISVGAPEPKPAPKATIKGTKEQPKAEVPKKPRAKKAAAK